MLSASRRGPTNEGGYVVQLNRESLIQAWRAMTTIRHFEERVQEEFSKGHIPGFVHLYAGQEASAVGVCTELGPHDSIASTHRGHGHSIAKGCDVTGMMAELFGKRDGLCGGRAARCTSPIFTRACSAPTASSVAARRWWSARR